MSMVLGSGSVAKRPMHSNDESSSPHKKAKNKPEEGLPALRELCKRDIPQTASAISSGIADAVCKLLETERRTAADSDTVLALLQTQLSDAQCRQEAKLEQSRRVAELERKRCQSETVEGLGRQLGLTSVGGTNPNPVDPDEPLHHCAVFVCKNQRSGTTCGWPQWIFGDQITASPNTPELRPRQCPQCLSYALAARFAEGVPRNFSEETKSMTVRQFQTAKTSRIPSLQQCSEPPAAKLADLLTIWRQSWYRKL